MSFGDFYDLKINGAYRDAKQGNQRNADTRHLRLIGTLVQRNLTIANVNIDELKAGQMQVKGYTTINKAHINKLADFRNTSLQTLIFRCNMA